MAKNGVFPRFFARDSTRNTPTPALLFSSGLVAILILMTYQKSMGGRAARLAAGRCIGWSGTADQPDERMSGDFSIGIRRPAVVFYLDT